MNREELEKKLEEMYLKGFEEGKKSAEREKGEWIPTSERLPEDGNYVLTSIKPKVGNYRIVISKFDDEEWWTDGTVQAWRPLPEPYKAEKGGK